MIPRVAGLQTLRVRTLIRQGMRRVFDRADALVAPAVPAIGMLTGPRSVTWPGGSEAPLASVCVRLSAPGDLTGLAALSMPCGVSAGGLPVAFQANGRPQDEALSLRLGAACEAAMEWSRRRPPL